MKTPLTRTSTRPKRARTWLNRETTSSSRLTSHFTGKGAFALVDGRIDHIDCLVKTRLVDVNQHRRRAAGLRTPR